MRRVVITGGPGSGKTTLIEALHAAGRSVSPESGRAIIKDQAAIDGRAVPWTDPALFAEIMLAFDLVAYRTAAHVAGHVYFDRGIPDISGYLRLCGLQVPAHLHRAAAMLRYDRHVFVAPHWPEIFAQDTERRQTQAEARETCAAVASAYRDLGYVLVELPRLPVAERVRFIAGKEAEDGKSAPGN